MKKTTVTVAIPAFNEAINIGNVLDTLMHQETHRVTIEKIVVCTDGSTDGTPEIVKKKMKHYPLLAMVQGKTQQGKFYRLNQIYTANTSDVLIVLDADIALVGKDFIEQFALAVIDDPKAMIVSAHEVPILPKDFIGRIITASHVMWDYTRWSIPNYDHVQNFYARATAYRGTFAKTLHIPEKAPEERLYLYLMAKKKDGYRYTRKAQIRYIPASSFHDYVKLADRSFGRPEPAVNEVFGYDVSVHCSVPRKYKMIGAMRAMLHDPFFTPLGILLGIWLSKSTRGRKTADSPIWEVSLSSKKSIQ